MRHSLVHRVRVASCGLGVLGIIALAVAACATVMQGCTAQQSQLSVKVLSMSAEECARLALQLGRRDVATACGVSESALQVLEQTMALTVCELPDAGGQ